MTSAHHTSHSLKKANCLRVAVSACLLGHKVRYDGSQKRHEFVAQKLTKWLELIPVCPEVEIGMGVPRPPIHLLERDGQLRAVGVENSCLDVTLKLKQYGCDTARRLENIDGYIFKARSPSCGLGSTPVKYNDGSSRKGAGLFAAQIKQSLPLLPAIEESQLATAAQQINFLQRVAAYRRWRTFVIAAPGLKDLQQFHQNNILLLMAHGAEGLRGLAVRLDKASQNGCLGHAQLQDYARLYMARFAHQATRRRHAIVLRRIVRLSRQGLGRARYAFLLNMTDAYNGGKLSLSAVINQLETCLGKQVLSEPQIQNFLALNVENWALKLMK